MLAVQFVARSRDNSGRIGAAAPALKMAFAQKLARNVSAYGAQTQQLMQEEVAKIKNDLKGHCENASNTGKGSFCGWFRVEKKVVDRQDYCRKKMRGLLKEGLADLGLRRCEVQHVHSYIDEFEIRATWTADAETSRKVITLATQGLFMALVGWIFIFVWMRGSFPIFPVAGASLLDL